MSLEGLSEQERRRLAQLMKDPLVPPYDPPPEKKPFQWPKWDAANLTRISRLAGRWRVGIQWPKWDFGSLTRRVIVHKRAWLAGGATAAGCLILLALAVAFSRPRNDAALQLEARESQGQLHIRWDPESGFIRRATNAKLFIIDGHQRLFVNLGRGRLDHGSVSYVRQSSRVDLRLALTEPDGRTVEQEAVFYASPVAEQETPQLSASLAPPASAPLIAVPVPVRQSSSPSPAATGQRSRRKPLDSHGTSLPFTCGPGDVFHKTDAPVGWNTFTCTGKNVWSVMPAAAGANLSVPRPSANAATLTAKPATTPIT